MGVVPMLHHIRSTILREWMQSSKNTFPFFLLPTPRSRQNSGRRDARSRKCFATTQRRPTSALKPRKQTPTFPEWTIGNWRAKSAIRPWCALQYPASMRFMPTFKNVAVRSIRTGRCKGSPGAQKSLPRLIPMVSASRSRNNGKQMKIAAKHLSLMKKAKVARVATVDPDGMPHVVAVCPILDGTKIYFASETSAKKVRNIRKNPVIAMVFDEYHDSWRGLKGVMIQGKPKIVGRKTFERVRAKLYRKFPQ